MVEFSCSLISPRWVEAILCDGEKEVKVFGSALANPLRDLVLSLAIMLEGSQEARFCWEDEPGEYRWIFRKNEQIIEVKILRFERNFSRLDDEAGRIIFAGSESKVKLGRMVLRQMDALLHSHGADGYRHYAKCDFPFGEVERLRMALKALKSLA